MTPTNQDSSPPLVKHVTSLSCCFSPSCFLPLPASCPFLLPASCPSPSLIHSALVTGTGCQGALELKDLEFTYPARLDTKVVSRVYPYPVSANTNSHCSSLQVFRGFSLVVPAGKTVALVGSSGSGKSTAIQLIERWVWISTGEKLPSSWPWS